MKRIIAISSVLLGAFGLLGGLSSCEKHSWEKETKKLYPQHDDHGHKKGEHKKEGEHKKPH